MTESKRAFYFKEAANSLVYSGVTVMRCYFIRNDHVVGVDMLPPGLSDQDAIAEAHKLSAKRKGPIDGFEVWDGAHLVIKHSGQSAPSIE